MPTTYLPIEAFALGLGPADQDWLSSTPQLMVPTVRVTIEYHHSAATTEAATLPNGDPGDEPQQEELDIRALFSAVALHFADEEGVQVTLPPRYDLRRCISTAGQTQIELAVLDQIRAKAGEAKLDAYLGSRA
jgi:hypothetical protein